MTGYLWGQICQSPPAAVAPASAFGISIVVSEGSLGGGGREVCQALGASQLSYRFGAAYSESKFRVFSLFFAAKGVLWLKPTALGAVVTSGPRSADAWGR